MAFSDVVQDISQVPWDFQSSILHGDDGPVGGIPPDIRKSDEPGRMVVEGDCLQGAMNLAIILAREQSDEPNFGLRGV